MSKSHRIPLFLLTLAILAADLSADTVTLKNGERIEATIASETPTSLTLEIQVSAGITDQRIVKKADVEKIDRIAPDETAYRAVMNLLPGKNSLMPAQYDAIIRSLQGFTKQHPESLHAADVQRTILAFEADKKRVDAGEVKLDGSWLSRQEAQKQRVQIGGMQAFNAMKSANTAGDAIGALNAFVTLEKNFPGAKVMPDAIQLARQILVALKPAAERALENSKVSKIDREQGFADAGPVDRADMMASYQREQAKADAALAAATTSNLWPPFLVSSDKCLLAIVAKAITESQRLEKMPVAAMRESIELAGKAGAEFADKNLTAATETLKDVTKLWPANELGIRLQAQITEAKNPPKVDPATPPPATPGAVKPGMATPAAVPPGATPAPGKSPLPAAATPAPVTGTTPVAAVPPPPAEPAEAAPPEEPPKPFFMTLGGAITIVIALAVILAAVNVFNKLRHRANDTLE
jgi:hypothetical protein